ncbi:MAG TPA: ATP-grasp domain-containing protein, partial [Candidatus Krumholzibacterium sp.]|nr:ATP-grasp domain-containing protein [Candidatus Krumholzibacterium sp.]
MSGDRVLVVGTTRDYIEYLDRARPGRIVFLTDPSEYRDLPDEADGPLQILSPLSETERVIDELESFLYDKGISLSGIACFDCESLVLAATLAARHKLPFPSVQAVLNCRDKSRSKMFWTREGIPCPRAAKAGTAAQAADFFDTLEGPAILKPATLSGSEAIFRCDSRDQVLEAFDRISDRLKALLEDPASDRDGLMEDSVLCEEYIEGPEYSCDFVRTDGPPAIIRLARKYLDDNGPPGTATAYEVPSRDLPVPEEVFISILDAAVRSLGLERCMGMADFIIRDSLPYFLEITPRPGGDCLPPLIRASSGFDILTAAIDFSEGGRFVVPPAAEW